MYSYDTEELIIGYNKMTEKPTSDTKDSSNAPEEKNHPTEEIKGPKEFHPKVVLNSYCRQKIVTNQNILTKCLMATIVTSMATLIWVLVQE